MQRVPGSCARRVEADGPDVARQIVIDEVQKVPALLDEAHWLIENRGLHFALCGLLRPEGQARRRKPARRTGDAIRALWTHRRRAWRRTSTWTESSTTATCPGCTRQAARDGCSTPMLPTTSLRRSRPRALVRNLQGFSGFLDAAALSDGEVVNAGQRCPRVRRVEPHRRWLPAYRKRPKRRVTKPKFYFADVGVVNRPGQAGPSVRRLRAVRQGRWRTGSSTSSPPSSATWRWTTTSPTGGFPAAWRSISS